VSSGLTGKGGNMLFHKVLLLISIFLICLLLTSETYSEASAFETEINLNTDERPVMVIKDPNFTDAEIAEIDMLIDKIPQNIRDELVTRYTGFWNRVFEEIAPLGDPESWRRASAYKEFMEFLEPLGLGMCPFFL